MSVEMPEKDSSIVKERLLKEFDEEKCHARWHTDKATKKSNRVRNKVNKVIIRKSKHFEDYIIVSEAFIADNEEFFVKNLSNQNKNTHWRETMDSEMTCLNQNKTWTLEEVPKYVKVISANEFTN